MKTIHTEKLTRPGSELLPLDQSHALSRFVHRFTREHVPAWTQRADCRSCPVQFASDADWLANTEFAIDRHGALKSDVPDCASRPTWPDNPELRQNYSALSPVHSG